MNRGEVSRAAIGRLPEYLRYLKSLSSEGNETVSAPKLALGLGLGEVQVRKDLCAVSGAGKPRIGYITQELIEAIESFLGCDSPSRAVVIGAGKLGRAILDYGGFAEYGVEVSAAFDSALSCSCVTRDGKEIHPSDEFESYCRSNEISVAILTVPGDSAQEACDMAVDCGIGAIWSFAPRKLITPPGVIVQYENMALSLASLSSRTKSVSCNVQK